MSNKQKKWNETYQNVDFSSAIPAQVLHENAYLLPNSGNALDLACGRAGNAQFLAEQGFYVDAVDYSPVLLKGLESYVKDQCLNIACQLRDIETDGLSAKKYDVIVVSYFLNRRLFPQIISTLKPDGLLFYQTWSQLSIDDSGPSNPEFRLQVGELLELCSPLRPILYRENGVQGDIRQGLRNDAILIAQKQSKHHNSVISN